MIFRWLHHHRNWFQLIYTYAYRCLSLRSSKPVAENGGSVPDLFGDCGQISDAILVAQCVELRAHSPVLAMESRFFRKMFLDQMPQDRPQLGEKLTRTLDDSTCVHDAETLPAFLYHRRSEVDDASGIRLSIRHLDQARSKMLYLFHTSYWNFLRPF